MAALGDNHARWERTTPIGRPTTTTATATAWALEANVKAVGGRPRRRRSPLFVTAVQGGAAQAGRAAPGDVIESINGSAPFIDGEPHPRSPPSTRSTRTRARSRLRLLRQAPAAAGA